MTFEAKIECGEQASFGVGTASDARVGRREVHQRLQAIVRKRGGLDVEEARWLLVARRLELHRDHQCATFREYLERVLGHKPHAAAERLRVAEALALLPVTRAALAQGELTYSAVREITRFVTSQTEAEWIEQVRGKTAREVEALAAGRQEGDRPGDPTHPDLRTRTVRLELSPESYALWCEVQRRVGAVDDSELVTALCRAQLAVGAEADSRGRAPAPSYQVAITVCAACKRGWQDGGGQVIEVGSEAIGRACCDAQELGRVDVDPPTPTTTTIPQAIRTRVFRRDHRRCVVPGCRSTRYLEVHHVVFREHGGGHEMSNVAVACAGHHDAVHQGRLVIRGDANRALTFQHADGRPWGAPEVCAAPAPAPVRPTWDGDPAAQVRSALRKAGFKPHEVAVAVERGLAGVGGDASVETLLRAALQACLRPRPG